MLSYKIPLTAFRQILILPLTLELDAKDGDDIAKTTRGVVAALRRDADWSEIPDHLEYLGSANDPAAYAEFVYFHPYIQDFLYDRGGDTTRPLTLFQRKAPGHLDIAVRLKSKSLDAELENSDNSKTEIKAQFHIDRIHLYFFELGVAILVLEVSLPTASRISENATEKPLSLAHAQAFQNALRRLYPPYFLPGDDQPEHIPEYPCQADWSESKSKTKPLSPRDWIAHVAAKRRNPVAPVWRDILAPLPIDADGSSKFGHWRQIIDERIPSMVCIGFDDFSQIDAGDFIRLCFLDEPDRGWPYAEKFMKDYEAKYCYDRHFFGAYGTRYFFSGYSMVMIGTGGFFQQVLTTHFRRHYFQMGLLIQFQFGVLLAMSHRVSQAVKDKHAAEKKGSDGEAFRKKIQAIEGQFLEFEQRYYFSQISNQLQAQEIYRLWTDRTGIDPLYRETRDQIRAASAYLDTRAQELQSIAATRLSVIATYGVIVGAAFAFLGMNVLASQDALEMLKIAKTDLYEQAGAFFAVLFVSFGAGLALLRLYNPPQAAGASPPLARHLAIIATLCAILSAAFLIYAKYF